MLTPVVCPPGRAMLAASPSPTMSSVIPTIGIVAVARWTAESPDIPERDDNIGLSCDELAGKRRHVFVSAPSPHKLEPDVASLLPTQLFHVAAKRIGENLELFRIDAQDADHGQPPLRARGERQKRRRAA